MTNTPEETPQEDVIEFGDYDLEDGVNESEATPAAGALDYPNTDNQDDLEGLGAPGDAPRNGDQAIALARQMQKNRTYVGIGYCLKTVRGYYGVAAKYQTASESWRAAKDKKAVKDSRNVPRGVPVYWTGGSHGYGHIAISIGGGYCLSTDWKEPGKIDVAKIDDITVRWGLHFEGYAFEVNDVIVWKPNPPKPAVALRNLHPSAKNDDVKQVKQALRKKGYIKGFVLTKTFGKGLKKTYAKYQTRLGYHGKDANGIPGENSLKKLGFRVIS